MANKNNGKSKDSASKAKDKGSAEKELKAKQAAEEAAALEEAKKAEAASKTEAPTKRPGRQQEWTKSELIEEMKDMATLFEKNVKKTDEGVFPLTTIKDVRKMLGVTQNHWNIAMKFIAEGDSDFDFLKAAAAPFMNRKGRIRDFGAVEEKALARQEKALAKEQERNAERIRKMEERHQAKMKELADRKAAAEAKAAEVKLQIQAKGQNVAAAVSLVKDNDDVTINVGAFMGSAHGSPVTAVIPALTHAE